MKLLSDVSYRPMRICYSGSSGIGRVTQAVAVSMSYTGLNNIDCVMFIMYVVRQTTKAKVFKHEDLQLK